MEQELAKRDESLKQTAVKLHKMVLGTLTDTHDLAKQRPVGSTKFLRVIEGTYRRAFSTLDAIAVLAKPPDYGLGNPSMILARSLVEDGVGIEYMINTDQEAQAIKFQEFTYYQGHEDNKFLKASGLASQPIIKVSIADIEKEYKKVKDNYINQDTKLLFRNWVGKDVEGLLRELAKINSPTFGATDIKGLARSYVSGNRKTHFNPIDIVLYLDQNLLARSYAESEVSALSVALSVYIRLTTRYIDTISHAAGKNTYHNIAAKVIATLKEMDKLEIYEPDIGGDKP